MVRHRGLVALGGASQGALGGATQGAGGPRWCDARAVLRRRGWKP